MAEDPFSRYLNERGGFHWPEDPEERNELASDIFGFQVVGRIDSAVEHAREVLFKPEASPEYRRHHSAWETDQPHRDCFATLTDEQRQLVDRYLRESLTTTIFSLLVRFDQFSEGHLDLQVLDLETEEPIANIVQGSIFDLHDRLGEWIERFSRYAEELE